MTPERWHRLESLFQSAITQAPGEREAWLEAACGGDAQLLQEVRRMIEADAQDGFEAEQIGAAAAELAQRPFNSAPVLRAGPYRLTKLLGRGGMGAVYLGERADGEYEAEVAVKLIHAGMDTDFFLARFRRERQALARLQHPNIARILDSGTTDTGLPFIVMELVRGEPITTYAKQKQLSRDQILSLYIEVCRAVSHAHQKLIVHRDLKPGNILVEEDGKPKLLDFGICKLIEDAPRDTDALTAAHLLTPEYASPEQVRGETVTVTSDVYSLGAVLYELLTGRPPRVIAKLTPTAIAAAAEEAITPPSQLMKDTGGGGDRASHFDAVVLKALHEDQNRRYQSVDELAEDLLRVLNRQQPLARNDAGEMEVASRRTRRLMIAGLAAAGLGGGIAWWQYAGRPEAVDESKIPVFLEAHRLLKTQIREETAEQRLRRSQQAVQLFEQAAREHPNSARIQAGLAESYEGIADQEPGKYYDYMRLCRAAAERGLRIDDRLDDLHYTMGSALLFGSWEIDKALASFTRAVQLNPRRGPAQRLRAEVLCMFGRFEEALAALGAAQASSPLDTDIGAEKAAVYFRWRRFAQAAESARQTLAIEPDNDMAKWVLGLALQHQGSVGEAEKIFRALPFRPIRNPIALAHLLASTGREKEALDLVARVRSVAPHPSAEALIYAVAGDRQTALKLLEEGFAQRDMNVLFFSMDPRYDILRREPRFVRICKQLGLPSGS